jgi:hypothetical protein
VNRDRVHHNDQGEQRNMGMTRTRFGGRGGLAAAAVVAAVGIGAVAWGSSATAGGGTPAAVAPHALAGFTISATQPQAIIGDSVTVTVSATAADDLYAYDLELDYDPAVLAYVDQSGSTDLTGSTFVTAPTPGRVSVVHTKLGSSPSATGQVTLGTFTFTAISDGQSSVSVPSLVEVTSSDQSTTVPDVAATDVTIARKAAPLATTLPTVTGTAKAGYVLAATTPSWSVEGVTDAYQWFSGGTPIAGATGTTYAVTPADVGSHLSVTVSGSRATYLTGTTSSASTVEVAGATTVTTAKKKAVTTKRGKRVTLTVTVSAPGLTPTGTVQLKTSFATKTVALVDGEATLTIRLTRSGKHTLKVKYLPASGYEGSRTTVTVTTR